MTAALWKDASESRLRVHVIEQDERFQRAMREELAAIAADRGLRLVPSPSLPVDRVRDVLHVVPSYPAPAAMTDAERIVREVCLKHQVTRAEFIGPQRGRAVVMARQEAAHRLKTETTLSVPQIGRKLHRDHTTVLHALNCYRARLAGTQFKKKRYARRVADG